jgi:subtilisin family serine protease
MFLGLAAVLTAASTAPKIEPRVQERARSEGTVPVFIVLSHQPQREILQRAESANALYRQVAESRYRQAAERALGGATELRQAREAAEAVTVRTRQQAFQAIEQAVGPEQDVLESRLRGLGATHISRYLGINMLAAEIPASAIGALEAEPEIARVFAVEKLHPQLATSVPALGAPAFWNAGYTGQGESVGVLDSGVRTNHPAFAGVPIVSQVFLTNGSTDPCFADNAGTAEDEQGHGTHVAGIVASHGSAGWTNYQGVAKGIGTLYNLKVGYKLWAAPDCDPAGAESDPRDLVAALDWAVANTSLKIFNYSYGSPPTQDYDDFANAVDQYIDTYGLTVTIAAGNGGPDRYGVSSPGTAYNGLTVANWVSRGAINSSSSRGPTSLGRNKPDLAAPGTNIDSAAYNWDARQGTGDDFVSETGTSMAAPHIAGSAALLESAGVTSPLAVKALLINSADSSGSWANDSGWGYANLNTAHSELNYASGSLSAIEVQLYKLSLAGAFRATATWNRHLSGSYPAYGRVDFNDINLYLCSLDTGALVASSTTTIQNVEQVSGTYTGNAVVAVAMASSPLAGVSPEPYGVAFSSPAQLQGRPALSPSCNVPISLASGSQFSVTCTVTNSGDGAAYTVAGQVTLPAGFSGDTQVSFGDVQSGGASSRTLALTASIVSGIYAIRLNVSTLCGLFAGTTSSTTTVNPAVPAPVLISPQNGAAGVSQTPTLSWSPSPGAASYDVYFGSSAPPPLVSSTTATSYSPSALNTGTLYYWRVVANNGIGGSSSSATWAFTTLLSPADLQQYMIMTVAGYTGSWSGATEPAPATSIMLVQPSAVTADAAGDFYISLLGRVHEVKQGIISIVAGGGLALGTGDGGPATSAWLSTPWGLATDGAGNLYIADMDQSRFRKVTTDGIIHTVVGNGTPGYSGDGGPATSAEIDRPFALAVDAPGNIYFGTDNRIRKVGLDGIINTVAGNGTAGYSGDGGPAVNAELNAPGGLAVDTAGDIYFSDGYNYRVRKVAPEGTITTVAGNGTKGYSGDGGPATDAQLNDPSSAGVDAAGNVYIADGSNFRIRKVTPNGIISTIAGNGTRGFSGDGAPATNAEINYLGSMAVTAAGEVYMADTYNDVIRLLVPANPSCQYGLDQAAIAVSGAGGNVPVLVHTTASCAWSTSGLPAWISISPASPAGVGSAAAILVVAPNAGPLRAATISIAGYAVTVTQADSGCTYELSPGAGSFIAAGGNGSVNLATSASCPWSVSSSLDWVTPQGPTYGFGNASITYSVAPNAGGARSGTLAIAGIPFNVQQLKPPVDGLRFVPVAPCRVADTRWGEGPLGGPRMDANSTRSFAIPRSNCGIPSTAQAYSLNVTVVPRGLLSYLTLWPMGQEQPFVSTLNSFGGIVVANAAIVPAGFDGAVSVFVTDATDVILDINGYFDSSSGANSYSFYPASPCRVADTRWAAGLFGGPSMADGETRNFPVYLSGCHVYGNAYAMNVTVVPKGYLGFLSAWPSDTPQPNVSTLNSWTAKVVANAAIIPVGLNGSASVYVSDSTDVILDVNGSFASVGGAGALNFYPVAPCRVADTRGAAGPKMGDAETRSFAIPSSGCGIPTTAAAYSLNVTVVPDGMLQYLTAWPTGAGQPFASTLNSWDGAVVANAAIVPAGAGGAINVFVANRTHVILDINGYFAP